MGAGALATTFTGKVAVAVALGVALSRNTVDQLVEALASGAVVTTTSGAFAAKAESTGTIEALVVAASLAISGAGIAAFSVSGAGAEATNVVLGGTRAYVDGGSVTTTGALLLTATRTATIRARVIAASGSVAIAGGGSGAASIGAAVAENRLGTATNRLTTSAFTSAATIAAGGAVTFTAVAGGTIEATVFAGAVAIAGSAGGSGAGSGSGTSATNTIFGSAKATIDGGTVSGTAVTLTASDTAVITILAGAASIAAAVTGGTAVAITIGAAISRNDIDQLVEASATGTTVTTTAGALAFTAISSGKITAEVGAASLAVAGSGLSGIGISGAGAGATNTIQTRTLAHATTSKLSVAGAATLEARSKDAKITARVLATSAALGVGTTGVGASIGVAVAQNQLGTGTAGAEISARLVDTEVTASGVLSLTATATGTIDAGVIAGSAAVAGGAVGIGLGGAGATATNRIRVTIATSIEGTRGTGVTALGIALLSKDESTITATVGAAALAAGFGGAGVALAVGVATARNEIFTRTLAHIGSATVAVVLPVSSGGELDGDLFPEGAGALTVSAIEDATITATAAAAAAAASAGFLSLSVAGAGAEAANVILTTTEAWIGLRDVPVSSDPGSTVSVAGAITITATNDATITAAIASAAASLGSGALAGAVSIGTSLARNFIGWTPGAGAPAFTPITVRAFISDSSVGAGGAIDVLATDTAIVTAQVAALSSAVALAAIGGIALAAAGAGVELENRVSATVAAFIASTRRTGVTAGFSVTVRATDSSTITADAAAASVAATSSAAGSTGVALSTGVSLTSNLVSNDVSAAITSAKVSSANSGSITVEAIAIATISATSRAASAAFTASGIAVSGGGASATAAVTSTVTAKVTSSTLTSAAALTIAARDTSRITAIVQAAALALAGLSGSAAGSVATVTVTPTLEASATSSTLLAGDAIEISATALEYGRAQADGIAIATGAAVADSQATATVSPRLSAFVSGGSVTSTTSSLSITARLNTAGELPAATTALPLGASAEARAASAAFISGTGPRSSAVENGTLSASASGGTLSAGGAITLAAFGTAAPDALTTGFAGGVAGIGSAFATATTQQRTTATLLSTVTAGASLTVRAKGILTPTSTAKALSGGVIAGSGAEATATSGQPAGLLGVQASLGAVDVTVSGAISVEAITAAGASATATGGAYGVAAVGVSLANATSDLATDASVATAAKLVAGSLAVSAQRVLTETTAVAVSSAGGLVGATGSDARATTRGTVSATTGANVALPLGAVLVAASGASRQIADARGTSGGLIAGGASLSSATSDIDVVATLGADPVTAAGRTGDLTVKATGSDENLATTVAGSGGFVSGNAATATMTDDGSVAAAITASTKTLYTGTLNVLARHDSLYRPTVDSRNAAVVGASGAEATATLNATAAASIAAGVAIAATGTVFVAAHNVFVRSSSGATVEPSSVSAAGGGGITATAALIRLTIRGTSTVTVGDGARITMTGTPLTGGGITMTASSKIATNDTIQLATGGAINGAGADVLMDARVDNTLSVGTGVLLQATGDISLGTYTDASTNVAAEVSTFGLAAVGVALATIRLRTDQLVSVGPGSTIDALGNVDVKAGVAEGGQWRTILAGTASAQGYVRGLIAVPVATADADMTSNATVTSAATIRSGLNTAVAADPGAVIPNADGTARGFQLGFIPVTVRKSTATPRTTSVVTLTGTVTAGAYSKIDLTIADCQDSGVFCSKVTDNGSTAPWSFEFIPSFLLSTFAKTLTGPVSSTTNSTDGISKDRRGRDRHPPVLRLGRHRDAHRRTAERGRAGHREREAHVLAASTTAANYVVLLGGTVPDLPGGQVLFTGAAKSGVRVVENFKGAVGSVTVENAYVCGGVSPCVGDSAFGPAIISVGRIENLGGSVTLKNTAGSVLELGAGIQAGQKTIFAPMGFVRIAKDGPEQPAPRRYAVHASGATR